ncbi:MAG: insulinase family protein [Oscillospiraceae bacterium]|nr:insulinase family protein [Oscillospiraceae bacterium]
MERREICKEVSFCYHNSEKFKRALISFAMFLPLTRESASRFSVIPGILGHSCKKYPDFLKLNKRLEELYGASISSDVFKLGDYQTLLLSATTLDEKFSMEDSPLISNISDLLVEIIFNPDFENGIFKEEAVSREKHQVVEDIKSEFDCKRKYSLLQCEKLVYAGQPSEIGRLGEIEEVEALNAKKLTDSYHEVLKTARIEITMVSSSPFEKIYKKFKEEILKLERSEVDEFKNYVKSGSPKELNEQLEVMELEQCKLVLGFVTGVAEPSEGTIVLQLVTEIFGGIPQSRLFINVREKMNLCYYCSAKYDMSKGTIFVESGVENKNVDKAKSEILRQLEFIKAGEVTEDEIESAKKFLCQIYRTTDDVLSHIADFSLFYAPFKKFITPWEIIEKIKKINKEQIVEAASKVCLDSVYMLCGREQNES